MLTIAGVTFTDTEVAEITADLERYERETMTSAELYQHEKAKRHDKLMAEAVAEYKEWEASRDAKKWFRQGKGVFVPQTTEG